MFTLMPWWAASIFPSTLSDEFWIKLRVSCGENISWQVIQLAQTSYIQRELNSKHALNLISVDTPIKIKQKAANRIHGPGKSGQPR